MFENTAIREGWERVKTGRDCWSPYSLVRLNKPIRPAILGVRQIYRAQEGNPGPPGAFSGLCSPVFPRLGVQTPPPSPSPSHRVIPSCSILAFGWGAHSGPVSGARHRQPTPPCSPEDSQPSCRDAEPRHHCRTCRGHGAGGCCPTPGCWGASTAISPEGGPGAMHVGRHPSTSKQTDGSHSEGQAHANGGSTKPLNRCCNEWQLRTSETRTSYCHMYCLVYERYLRLRPASPLSSYCWGLLDVVREAWKKQPTPHRSMIEHVKGIRENKSTGSCH